jgi:hypothetical protein
MSFDNLGFELLVVFDRLFGVLGEYLHYEVSL